MKAMQASTPGGPEALEIVDRPVPQPGPGQVQRTAHAIGVSTPDAPTGCFAGASLSPRGRAR